MAQRFGKVVGRVVEDLCQRAKQAAAAHTNLFLDANEAAMLADLLSAVASTSDGASVIRGVEMRCRLIVAATNHPEYVRDYKTE
jgi:hypothetical protein